MNKRYYALFERIDGKWIRVSECAYTKPTAVRVFQSGLLEPYLGGSCGIRELRIVPSGDRVKV